jgi:hypothetical protein
MTLLTCLLSVALLSAVIFLAYTDQVSRDLRKSEASAWDKVIHAEEECRRLNAIVETPPLYWLVGQYRGGKSPVVAWDLIGIFADKEAAIALCILKTHFIVPVMANRNLLEDPKAMPEIEYPLVKEAV